MAPPDRFDNLRHAALDVLDAGDSMASVSRLPAVPLAVVERWRQEPRPPRRAVQQASDGQGRGLRFSTTLVIRRGFPNAWMRHVAVGHALSALAVGLVAWSLNHPGSLAEMLEVDVTSLIGCAWWWFQRQLAALRRRQRGHEGLGLEGEVRSGRDGRRDAHATGPAREDQGARLNGC